MNGSVAAQIFYLANRDRENWQHVSKIEHTGNVGNFVAWLPRPDGSTEEWAKENGCGAIEIEKT